MLMNNCLHKCVCASRAPVLSLFSFLYPRARVGPVRISVDGEHVGEYRDPPELQSALTAAPGLSADETRRESDLVRSATDAARKALTPDPDASVEVPLYRLAYTRCELCTALNSHFSRVLLYPYVRCTARVYLLLRLLLC